MKKYISLLKAAMTDNMNLFKIYKKNQNDISKKLLPIILFGIIFFYLYNYANILMSELNKVNMAFVGLTIVIFSTVILTLIEGIYKSSNLLFNCKDDNLLLSLPIKKKDVLFVRIFKFYVFELLYNSMFLLPAMAAYIKYSTHSFSYYLVSIVAIFLLPMIPVAIACIIGMFISSFSSIFKKKNIVQIIVTILLLLGVLYLSFNLEGLMKKVTENATSINDMIIKLYYPLGLYINLITNFKIIDFLLFIFINMGIFVIIIMILSKLYFKTNSNANKVLGGKSSKDYKIKENKPINSLIKKELNRFTTSPVFITNAGFGLVLFIIGCILLACNFDSTISNIAKQMHITIKDLKSYMPLILFIFVIFSSLMTSITSSMISLEGKSFNILKSLPVKPYTIIKSKILTAVLVMIPCLLVGDMILFIRFSFNLLEVIMILIATFILPFVSETIGIIVNLKYPNMDALNDTEVVKQSMSSTISVFIGMALIGTTVFVMVKLVDYISIDLVMFLVLLIYVTIYIGLYIYISKTSVKIFNKINV